MDSKLSSTTSSINNTGITSLISWLVWLSPALSVFSGLLLAPVFVSIILLYTIMYFSDKNRSLTAAFSPLPVKILLISLLWAGISCLWTVDPFSALQLWGKLAVILIGGAIAIEVTRTHCHNSTYFPVYAFILSLLLVAIELFTHGNLISFIYDNAYHFETTDLNRAATVLALFIWPVLSILLQHNKKMAAIALWLATTSLIVSLESLAAVLAMMAGMVCFMLVYATNGKAVKLLFAVTLLFIIATPPLMLQQQPQQIMSALPHIPESAEHRLYIWEFTSHKALIHPVRGWGMDSSRHLAVHATNILLRGKSPLPLHPHNSILQLWLELGLAGVLIFAAFMASLFYTVKHSLTTPLDKAIAVSSLTAYMVIGFTAFGIWQEWWLSAGFLLTLSLVILNKKLPIRTL
jgi:O-antigen ligase